MVDNSLRVRLVFEDERILSKSQRWQGLKQSWLLLNRTQHPNISHLSDHLLHHFNLNRSCPHGLLLSMDDFVLPPFESTSILKDKEIISVKKKGSKSSKTIKVADNDGPPEELGIVEKQLLPNGLQLLANEEFDTQSGDYLSETEEDEDAVAIEYTSGGNALSKKRKASERLVGSKKKKHKSSIPDGAKRNHLTNEIKSRNGDGVIVSKSHCRKGNVFKRNTKEDSEDSSESAESSSHDEFAKCVKSDQHKENDKRIEDTSHAPTKKLPSRSARRKKAKRQWLRAMAKIGKKDDCDIRRPKQQERRSKAEKKEVICQSKGLLHWRQSREGCNHYKKEDNNTILARPGHIRFDPLDEDEAVQKSQESMGTFQGNEITTGMKEQRWGTKKISSTQRKDNVNINKDHLDTSNIEKDIRISAPIESDKLPPLPGNLPKEGYIIAYRLLQLSSAWTTDPSESRVGRVLWYRPESRRIMLAPVPEYPVILEKFDGDKFASQPDTSRCNDDGSLEIDFRALLDVRLVAHTDANSGNVATVEVDEGVLAKDVASNLVKDGDKQEHTPNKGNGEPNMWDHFTKALDTENSELSENKWGTWSERASKKSWPSYRAWKGSSVGPAMARLGSKQDPELQKIIKMTSKLIASELSKIERLNGVNYDMWSRKIRYGLIHDNLEAAIEMECPVLGDSPTDAQKKEHEEWKLCDRKAKSLMLMFMENNLIKVFETFESAKKLWDALKEKYDSISDVNVQLLLHKYNTCKMSEKDNVIDHCNKMLVMAKDLAAAGNELSKNMQIAVILNSLPSSLNMAATTLRLNGTIKNASQLSTALVLDIIDEI